VTRRGESIDLPYGKTVLTSRRPFKPLAIVLGYTSPEGHLSILIRRGLLMLRWTKTSPIALRFVDSDEHGKRQNNERKLSHFDSPRPRAKKLNKPNFKSLALPCHAKEKTYVPLSWHDFSRAHGMVTRRCSKNRGQWVTRFACQLPPTTCPRIPAPTSNLTLIFRIGLLHSFHTKRASSTTVHITGGYSTENSPAIFMRGGEPWVMNYCWRTQKC